MTKVLVLKSSILGANSASNGLIEEFMTRLAAALPEARFTVRDLASEPLPPLDAAHLTALAADAKGRDRPQQDAVALADTLIAELRSADVLVLGAPMYNFTVPATLKTWIDHVARAGVTFRYTESGPEGLLGNKQVVVFATMGGQHEPGATDYLRPYLTTALGLLGLNRIETISADGLNLGEEPRQRAMHKARACLLAVADRLTADLQAGNGDSAGKLENSIAGDLIGSKEVA